MQTSTAQEVRNNNTPVLSSYQVPVYNIVLILVTPTLADYFYKNNIIILPCSVVTIRISIHNNYY